MKAKVRKNDPKSATAIAKIYPGQYCAFIARIAGNPPIPTPPASTPKAAEINPATAEAVIAATKGYIYFRFAPNIAGSVTPSHADIVAEAESDSCFLSFLYIKYVAATAPDCAILLNAIMGHIIVPCKAGSAISWKSTARNV